MRGDRPTDRRRSTAAFDVAPELFGAGAEDPTRAPDDAAR